MTHDFTFQELYDMLRLSWSIQVEILLKWFELPGNHQKSMRNDQIARVDLRNVAKSEGMEIWNVLDHGMLLRS